MQKILEDLLSENMSQWLSIPRCREGDKIYHYTNLSSLKGIVTEHSFWVSNSDFLNDIYVTSFVMIYLVYSKPSKSSR